MSVPTRLSIHLFSNCLVGRLPATDSVNSWYSLCIGLRYARSFLYLMLSRAVSDDITELRLYKINLLESISDANVTPVPTGFAIMFATSAALRNLPGIFAGIIVIFFTQ